MPEQYNTSIKRTGYYLKKMIQVFIDILKNTHRDIHISQIASIIIAETNYLLNIRSWSPSKELYNFYHFFDIKLVLESEIHNWLLFLQEDGTLPGNYERFTGFYIGKNI